MSEQDDPYRTARAKVYSGSTTCFVLADVVGITLNSSTSLSVLLSPARPSSVRSAGPNAEVDTANRFKEMSAALIGANP